MQFLHRFMNFLFVFSLTTSGLFIILDTVATDTPAYSATSTMVAIFIPFSFSAIPKYFLPEFYSFIIKNRTDICPVSFYSSFFLFFAENLLFQCFINKIPNHRMYLRINFRESHNMLCIENADMVDRIDHNIGSGRSIPSKFSYR